MNKYILVTALSFMTFLNVMCHRDNQRSALLVTRSAQPHTPKELLQIAENILKAEREAKKQSAKNKETPEAFRELHLAFRRRLNEVVSLMDKAQETERVRAQSVPVETTLPPVLFKQRPKSAPNLHQ